MPATPSTFDDRIARWKQEMDLPWARLKYKLAQSNLARHLPQGSMTVLDAGGGNGLDSLPFARQGHKVDLVDYSQEMLADARVQVDREHPRGQLRTHLSDIRKISALFPEPQFDLVLCHNVLQYVEDVPELLADLARVLKPGGVISIISINRFSTTYHTAFLDGDLTTARAQLAVRTSEAKIFDAAITSYSAEEMKGLLEHAGIFPQGDYGLRCICDYWGDNERKSDPEIFGEMERLEFALTDRHPYKLLARYFQVIGRKPGVT